MYAVWFRLAPHREWQQAVDEDGNPQYRQDDSGHKYADLTGRAVVAALKLAGYPSAQAEVREAAGVASGIVSTGSMVMIGEHFPDQEQVTLIGGFMPPTGDETPLPPAVDVGHGETPPPLCEGCGMWVGHAPGCPKMAHLPPGVNMR
jgi:hypothetical protein